MRAHVVAMGKAGAAIASALLFEAAAQRLEADEIAITLVRAPKAGEEQVLRQAQDYAAVRENLPQGLDGGFASAVTVKCWPKTAARASLNDQAASVEDRLLCRALFTREQACLSPARALDDSERVAATTWASLLLKPPEGALGELLDDVREDPSVPVVLCGSLCEAVCVSGVPALSAWLKREAGSSAMATLLLPIAEEDNAALSRRALLSGKLETELKGLCLLGLPEDCRQAEDGGAHLADWLAASAVERQLAGQEGEFAWRVPADALRWSAFGDQAAPKRAAHESLMKMTCLLSAVYGETLENALRAPKRLRDRMTPWYSAHFGAVRKVDDAARERLAQDAHALRRLTSDYAQWMLQIQRSLPPMMRWADALREARRAAGEHYAAVLDAAGQLAWMEYEAEKSGLADEQIVHRHDMQDSEAEAALKQIADIKEKLETLSRKQDELNAVLGGRLTRSLLEGVEQQARKEADELGAQAEEGWRRIRKAAEIATVEEMPKVETARIRLNRMERHVALLKGRADQAKADAERWNQNARRGLPPKLPDEGGAAQGLFASELLETLGRQTAAEGKEARQTRQRMIELWPWTEQPMRALCDRVARNEFPSPAPTCLGSFVRCLQRLCGEKEGA